MGIWLGLVRLDGSTVMSASFGSTVMSASFGSTVMSASFGATVMSASFGLTVMSIVARATSFSFGSFVDRSVVSPEVSLALGEAVSAFESTEEWWSNKFCASLRQDIFT